MEPVWAEHLRYNLTSSLPTDCAEMLFVVEQLCGTSAKRDILRPTTNKFTHSILIIGLDLGGKCSLLARGLMEGKGIQL